MELCQTTKFQIHWCLKVTMYRVSQSCSPPELNMASTNISWNKIWKPLNSLEDDPQKNGVPESILRSGLVLPSEAELLEQNFRHIEIILDRFSLYNLWLKVIDGDWSMLLVNGFIPRKKHLHIYQWEIQDPKMEVLYHIRPYFAGIFP